MRRRTGLLIAVTAGVVLAGASSMLLAFEGGAGCRQRCADVRDRCKQACSSKSADGMQPACLENCNTEYDSCIVGCS